MGLSVNSYIDFSRKMSVTTAELAQNVTALAAAIDATYYLLCACLVFFMQIGFAMLEVGCVSSKNIKNIILKDTLDIAIGAISFWAVGFAIAYGGSGKCIDGSCTGWGNTYHEWFFQFAFAATAATIVSG